MIHLATTLFFLLALVGAFGLLFAMVGGSEAALGASEQY